MKLNMNEIPMTSGVLGLIEEQVRSKQIRLDPSGDQSGTRHQDSRIKKKKKINNNKRKRMVWLGKEFSKWESGRVGDGNWQPFMS